MIDEAVIILCSRSHSKRLPLKCFNLINGKTVLEHIFERLTEIQIPKVLAIPSNEPDVAVELYEKIANHYNVDLYLGDPESPLHRMAEVLNKKYKNAKYAIRITHDDIIIDDGSILDMVQIALENEPDYIYAPTIIEGAGVEIIKADNIRHQAKKIKHPVEHISYFVKYGDQIIYDPRAEIQRPYRLTLDYPEDKVVLNAVMNRVGNVATVDDICEYLDKNRLILEYNKNPDITLYTCCYNAEKYISEAIESAIITMKTNRLDMEYIIVDDCSTDASLEKILTQIGLWKDMKIKVISNEKNVGLASSSNIALENSRGQYIMRLDADDTLNPWSLSPALKKMKAYGYAILYPNYYRIDEEGNQLGIVDGAANHHAGGALMDKRIINELKFKEGLKHWDSLDLFYRLKDHEEIKIGYTDDIVFNYRRRAGSLSSNNTKERRKILKDILGAEQYKKIYKSEQDA